MTKRANKGERLGRPVLPSQEIQLSPEVLRSKRVAHLYLGSHRDADKDQLKKVADSMDDFLRTHPGQSALVLVEAYGISPQVTTEVHKLMRKNVPARIAFLNVLSASHRAQGDQASYQQITNWLNQDNEFISQALRDYDAVSRKYPGRVRLLFEPFPDELADQLTYLSEERILYASSGQQALERGQIEIAALLKMNEIVTSGKHTRLRENALGDEVTAITQQNDEALLLPQGSGKKPFRIGLVTGYYGGAHTRLIDLFSEKGFDVKTTYPQLKEGETFVLDWASTLTTRVTANPAYAQQITLKDATRAVFSQAVYELLDTHSEIQPSNYQQIVTSANQKVDAVLLPPVTPVHKASLTERLFRRGRQQSPEDNNQSFNESFTATYTSERNSLLATVANMYDPSNNVDALKRGIARAALKDRIIPWVMSERELKSKVDKGYNVTNDEVVLIITAYALAKTLNSIFDLGLSFSL